MGRTSSSVPHTYLKRGIYYFVRRVPSDLQRFYRVDRVVVSLRTKCSHNAYRASQLLSSRLEDHWLNLRLSQSGILGERVVNKHSTIPHDSNTLGVTLSQASDLYQSVKGKDRSKTFFTHTDRAVGYAIECLGDNDLSEYTTIHAGAFRDWLFAKGLKRSSVSRNLSILKAVTNLCIQEMGLTLINPFSNVYIPHDECQTKRHSLTSDQIRLLQHNCKNRDDSLRWLAALISDTGMRLAEAVGLATQDLRLDADIAYVRIQRTPWRTLKTSGSERTIPLVGASLWAARRLTASASGRFLFPQYVDGSSTNANSASAALNKWIKTFLPRDCVVHGMRHAFRDRLRAVDMPADMIDQIGGWSTKSIGTTYGRGYDLRKIHQILVRITLDTHVDDSPNHSVSKNQENREDSS